MGLILPQTVKVRTSKRTCKYYREKGYTFKKWGDIIEVNVLDLSKRSHEMVKVVCDVCGKESEMWYRTVIKCNEENKLITCTSNSCANKKREDTCTKKYSVKNVIQSQEVKNKMEDTNLERYGAKSPFGSKEIQDKAKITCKERYGAEYAAQNKEIQDKMKDTRKERYGYEYMFQSQETQDKIKVILKEKYGVENPMQCDEIKNKILETFQFNGTGPCSRAQKYIHFLIGGALNKRICNSLVDICFEEEKTAIEYDGGGHFLGELIVNKDRSISKEALLKEKNREDSIVNKGYKVIRFIATKDRIPSDEVILNLIEEFKNSDFKVVRIDFEEGTIEKDYNEKTRYDFGKLRRITKEDLEQFESEKKQ